MPEATVSTPVTTSPPAAAPPQPAATAPASQTPPASALSASADAAPQAEATKPDAAKSESAPAPLELKLPEGFQTDEKALADFKALASEYGLDAPKAQGILDKYVAIEMGRAKAEAAAFEAQDKKWAESLKADPDIGGDKWPASQQHIRRALDKFGGKELSTLLHDAGLGNNPVLVKAFVSVGRALAEDSVAGTSAPAAGRPAAEAQLQSLYPSMFPKE